MQYYTVHLSHIQFFTFKLVLRGAFGTQLQVVGECMVTVSYNNKSYSLPLVIVQNKLDIPLLGRT